MKEKISPASLITLTGAVLTVIGCFAYITSAVNLSVPTLFYGFPIFLGGLALKTTELRPTKIIFSDSNENEGENAGPPELEKLVKDVTRWRYGQHAHLESSLKALDLWDQGNPPQLLEIEELNTGSGYGVRLRFEIAGVSIERWHEKRERLGRFFAKGLQAEIINPSKGMLDLMIIPQDTKL